MTRKDETGSGKPPAARKKAGSRKVATRKAASEKVASQAVAARKEESGPEKKTISPMERWKMVAEAAYYRAQKRGFIGGNPISDWTEAEKEIDAQYTMDYGKIMISLDSSEMMEQFARVFGGVLHQPNLNDVLESQRKSIEALIDANKVLFDDAQGIIDRQMDMFRDTMNEAVSLLGDTPKAKSSKDRANQQARLIQLGIEKSLASMRDITESIAKANAQVFDIADKRMAGTMFDPKQFMQKPKG